MKIRSVGKMRGLVTSNFKRQLSVGKKFKLQDLSPEQTDYILTKGYGREALDSIFKKNCNKESWKSPFTAIVDNENDAKKLGVAIEYFHATTPKIRQVTVPVRHKEGLVWMEGTAWEVSSDGYQAW